MIRTQSFEYDFATAKLHDLQTIVSWAQDVAVAEMGNAFTGFECIALACHGPPKEADGDVEEGEDEQVNNLL